MTPVRAWLPAWIREPVSIEAPVWTPVPAWIEVSVSIEARESGACLEWAAIVALVSIGVRGAIPVEVSEALDAPAGCSTLEQAAIQAARLVANRAAHRCSAAKWSMVSRAKHWDGPVQ